MTIKEFSISRNVSKSIGVVDKPMNYVQYNIYGKKYIFTCIYIYK